MTGENKDIQTEFLEAVHEKEKEAKMSQLNWIQELKDMFA